MKITVFSSKPYDEQFLTEANNGDHELSFIESRLNVHTAKLAGDSKAVCVFVNDDVSRDVMDQLKRLGVQIVALRCAGFNNVDLDAAKSLGIKVVRVPAYSPYAVAEHAVALIMALNRNTHRAHARVREGNFMLNGLMGFDLNGCTVGLIGTGIIGSKFARIMAGFGCRLLGSDVQQNPDCIELGMQYVSIDQLLSQSDIVSLHCPLTPDTHHLIDEAAVKKMKHGAMLINTSRGAVIDSQAVIQGLKSGQIGHVGLDVYEEEAEFFFEDLSNQFIADDTLSRLLTFPNVLITGHQGFFTRDALSSIASTTLQNIADIETTGNCDNTVK